MTVDVQNRRRMAKAIEAYLEHRIDNFALDDALTELKQTHDEVCRAIAEEMWFSYDDCSRHRNEGKWKICSSAEQAIQRWLMLLHSDCEWDQTAKAELSPVCGFRGLLRGVKGVARSSALTTNEFWPWPSKKDWLRWLEEGKQGTSSLDA